MTEGLAQGLRRLGAILPLLVFALTPPTCFLWLDSGQPWQVTSALLLLAIPYIVLAVAARLHPSPHAGLTDSLSRSGDIALLSSVTGVILVRAPSSSGAWLLGATAWMLVVFPFTVWLARRNLLRAMELRRMPEDALDWKLAVAPEPADTPPTFWVLQCLKVVLAVFLGLLGRYA
ncbi:MAG: hypothetical protein R3F05_16915 [Planctomycetota bacterium]